MKFLKRTFLVIIFAVTIFPSVAGHDIKKLLPAISDLPGWKISEEPRVFSGDELFDLIDGGADLYYEYGFQQVVSTQYTDPSANTILVEIYEMDDVESAYGIFSISQQVMNWTSQYGSLSAVNENYISFWKDRFCVNLSWSSKQHTEEPLLATLAEMISGNIRETGELPGLVKSFRQLEPGGNIILLKGNIALSNFYYFDYKDVFKIREAAACTTGNLHIILIRYKDQPGAIDVVTNARQDFSNSKRFTDITMAFQGYSCRDNKDNNILVRQTGRYLVILVSGSNDVSLVHEMDDLTGKIERLPPGNGK